MGRRKIEIEFIREDRSRATTFIKRKSGLFKKAHELAILTGAQVAVVVFSQQDKLFTYSNEPCTGICTRFLKSTETYESKGPNDYTSAQDHDDDSDEEAPPEQSTRPQVPMQSSRRNSSTHSKQTVSTPPPGRHASRRNSVQMSPRLASPHRTTPLQQQGEFSTASSPNPSLRKRAQSPVYENAHDSPKFMKHEQIARDISDVRSSPHQVPRPQGENRITASSNPPSMQAQEFSMPSHTSAPMIPPRPSTFPHGHHPPSTYATNPQQQHLHHRHGPMSIANGQQQQSLPPPHQPFSSPMYNNPSSSSTRHLPMAPPLTIPSNPQGAITPTTLQQTSSMPQASDSARSGQPLLPAGSTNSGNSRVLLPGETSSGLTPIESPNNFASSLYSSSGITGIGTNIAIPRISTDVGSLFYNWNTNEPGLSPATSMMLGQFREMPETNSNPGGPGTAQPQTPARSQLSGPPISAGVLENFSPTTAQWLSGHSTQAPGARPY